MPPRRRGLNFDISAEDRSDRAFRSLNQNLNKTQGALRGLRGPMGALFGGAAVAGIAEFTRRSIAAGDAIAKTADKIGITTDALQEYSHVADLAGVSQERFTKGVTDFTRRFGELRNNTGSLVTFLDKYDKELLSVLRTQTDTTEAFEITLDAMAKAPNAAERAALGFAAFGRAGVDMANVARTGAEEIARLRQEARDLGIVIDERLLRNAEKAQDQLSTLGRVIKTNLTAAVLELAPLIADLSESLVQMTPAIRKSAQGILAWAGAWDALSADRLLEELDKIDAKIETVRVTRAGPVDMLAQALGFNSQDEAIAALEQERAEIVAAIAANRQAIENEFLRLPEVSGAGAAGAAGAGGGVDPFGGRFRAARPRQKPELPGPADITPTTEAIRQQILALERLNKAYEISAEEGKKVELQLEREAAIRAAGKNLTAEQTEELDKLLQKRQELEAIQQQRNDTLETEIEKQSELNGIMKNETLNILRDLQGGYRSFEEVALGVLERIIAKLFELNDAQSVASLGAGGGGTNLISTLAGLIGFGGGGTSFPASAAATVGISTVATGGMLSGPIPGRQGGGPVTPGGLFEVAERTTARGLFMPIERGGILRAGMGPEKSSGGVKTVSVSADINLNGMTETTMRNPAARAQIRADFRDVLTDAARDV